MGYKKALKEKIEKNRKLVNELKEHGVNPDFNEETGEITIAGSEWNKPEVRKWIESNGG